MNFLQNKIIRLTCQPPVLFCRYRSILSASTTTTFHSTSINNNNASLSRKNQSMKKNRMPADDLGEWIPIYKFPYIVPCRIFARAKLHMTIMMTTILPASYFINAASYESNDLAMIGGISTFSLILIYGFGQIFRRLIGSIYISADKK
ncbi:hypothetical protein DERP_003483 [Dermatophagoides pteronyssinus]|uniref:Transmembrane protein 186 n=1 Tax=Dermatophagoides pteronyssinus TaxID=6956 RepID=A0ABQ8JLL8_DERPT|nr:hypothetical protein DERP_003483 [Dermatophagoides pteronyssinus]